MASQRLPLPSAALQGKRLVQAERRAWAAQEAALASELSDRMMTLGTLQAKAELESDPLVKQQLILQLRQEQRDLNTMAKNVKSVEKKLDIVIDFLSDMQGQLTAINSKLDALQENVVVMRADLRRLTGKPVLEVFAEERRRVLARADQLPSEVYIEQLGLARGTSQEHAFEADGSEATKNVPFPLIERCKRFFAGEEDPGRHVREGSTKQLHSSWNHAVAWKPKKGDTVWVKSASEDGVHDPATIRKVHDDTDNPTFDIAIELGKEEDSVPRSRLWDSPPKSLLLVHGVAGSGKSVVSRKMYQYLCGEFYDKRQQEGVMVVPIFCNLPALANPLTDLVGGTLRAAPYNLRDTQIAELLELARGEGQHRIEVVFVLDGYDELRPECLWKNLFLTNNLDQYREAPHVPKEAGSEPAPELASSTVNHARDFAFPKVRTVRCEIVLSEHCRKPTNQAMSPKALSQTNLVPASRPTHRRVAA